MSTDIGRKSVRSSAPLTVEHLARVSELAQVDHEHFTRDEGHPEYRDRRLTVVLAQGAAEHFVDGRHGVKDLDVCVRRRRSGTGRPFPAVGHDRGGRLPGGQVGATLATVHHFGNTHTNNISTSACRLDTPTTTSAELHDGNLLRSLRPRRSPTAP